jgi:hypothetical protein
MDGDSPSGFGDETDDFRARQRARYHRQGVMAALAGAPFIALAVVAKAAPSLGLGDGLANFSTVLGLILVGLGLMLRMAGARRNSALDEFRRRAYDTMAVVVESHVRQEKVGRIPVSVCSLLLDIELPEGKRHRAWGTASVQIGEESDVAVGNRLPVLVDLARLGETQSFSLLVNGYRTWGPAVKG